MGFFADLGNMITGKSGQNIINNEIGSENQISNAQLNNELALAKLQNDPMLLKTKQNTTIAIIVVAGIVMIIILKVIK